MTVLFYLVAAFACFVFALVIIRELKKAPHMDSPFDPKHERLTTIDRRLRDRGAIRDMRIQKPKLD